MAYTRTYTIDANPSGDTVKVAIATKLDGDLTNIFSYLNTHEGLTTGIHGVGSGTIVGTSLTQTLTNKTLTSPALTGSIDNTNGTISGGIISSTTFTGTITASGATILSPTITAPTLVNGASTSMTLTTPTLTGSVTATGSTINIGNISGGTIASTTLSGTITASSATVIGGTLSAPTLTGTVTASGATISSPTITGAAITSSTVSGVTVAGGTNTFNIANGTASLDIAAGATLNIDKSLTVDGQATTITGAGQANTITLNESITIGDGYSGTLTYSATGKTLTVEGTSVVNQDLTTDANVQFSTIELGHATDTTLARVSAGVVSIEGKNIYVAGGTDVAVADGGTGTSTLTDHGVLLGSGTDAITPMSVLGAGELIVGVAGADPHALSAGTTEQILVGGGAADPVWTTATGTGAPVRATSPTLVTPALGTPASGNLQNCIGGLYYNTSTALAGTDGKTITHNKGDTNYFVYVSCKDIGLSMIGDIWVVKAANTAVVYNSGVSDISADISVIKTG